MIWLLLAATIGIDEPVLTKVLLPLPAKRGVASSEPKYDGFKTHTKNFIIYGVDQQQIKEVREHIEHFKNKVLLDWDLPNIDFKTPVVIVCVPTSDIMREIFRSDDSTWEDQKGVATVWILPTASLESLLPAAILPACISQIEKVYNYKCPLWFVRGATYLTKSTPEAKARLASLEPMVTANQPLYYGHDMLIMTAEQWAAQTPDLRNLFDVQSIALVLMVRKELGVRKLISFIQSNKISTLGFTTDESFDKTYRRYVTYLTADAKNGIIPDKYLQVGSKIEKRTD